MCRGPGSASRPVSAPRRASSPPARAAQSRELAQRCTSSRSTATVRTSPPAARRPAPPLAGTTLTGHKIDLASLHGQVVVINFWGSWCALCRAESSGLQHSFQANRARQVAFVGVDERDGLAAARSFTQDKGVTYPSLFDSDGTLVSRWPAGSAIPFTFVIDRRGRIATRFTGAVLPTDLQPAVTRAADEQ